jgi:hypothetical protein
MTKHTPENGEAKDVDLGEVYSRTELFIENNKKAITIVVGAIGIVAVVLGVLLGTRSSSPSPRPRKRRDDVEGGVLLRDRFAGQGLNGDDQWPGFQTIADEYGSTPSGNLAHTTWAIYMQKGEFEPPSGPLQACRPG